MRICINGKYRDMTDEEIAEIETMRAETFAEEQIAELQMKLDETDYKAIKYAEGWITEEDYADTKAQRQSWREQINSLQAESEVE